MNDKLTVKIEDKLMLVRDQYVLLDRDVTALYGVQTKEINQAVRNNPEKFPDGFVQSLTKDEVKLLRSKILTLEDKAGRGRYSKHGYKVFTERGLYMLATYQTQSCRPEDHARSDADEETEVVKYSA